jgi:hypothetical protein
MADTARKRNELSCSASIEAKLKLQPLSPAARVMSSQDSEFELPSELWFKIIAFVLSDTIHAICCSPHHLDLSWDRHAFGTLRLVSLTFSNHAVKVAELALSVPPCLSSSVRLSIWSFWKRLPIPFFRQSCDGAVEPQGDTNMVVDGDAAKLK